MSSLILPIRSVIKSQRTSLRQSCFLGERCHIIRFCVVLFLRKLELNVDRPRKTLKLLPRPVAKHMHPDIIICSRVESDSHGHLASDMHQPTVDTPKKVVELWISLSEGFLHAHQVRTVCSIYRSVFAVLMLPFSLKNGVQHIHTPFISPIVPRSSDPVRLLSVSL